MNDSIALSTRETSAKSFTTQCLWILMDKIDRCFLCCGSWKMSRVQFEIEQDEEANVFVASWDDPTGGGITTQARSLSELYEAIQESVRSHFADRRARPEGTLHFKNAPTFHAASS